MADQLQLRGGTTAEHATFTGALREVTVDTDKDTVVVHDNATVGGHPLAKENLSNVAAATAATKLDGQTIKFGGGAAATPSLTFNGDLNTGIYSPGADQVAISTNGTGRLFVDSSGRIGVGTSSPQHKLAVVSSGVGYEIDQSSIANTNLLLSYDRAASAYRAVANYYGGTYSWNDGGTERMRIDSSGRLGVGTSSPGALLDLSSTTSAKLNLTYPGFGIATLASDSTGALLLQADEANAQASSLIQFKVDGSERARIDSSGRLGVGTTSPSEKLHVAGNLYVAGGDIYIDTAKMISTSNTNPLRFGIGASEKAQIDGSGRLLVGTSSAFNAGAAAQYGKMQSVGNTADSAGAAILALGRGEAASAITAGEGLGFITFSDNTGNEFATILCAADATAGSGDYPGRLVFSTTADGASSPTERMRIDNAGNLLLNATSVIDSSMFSANIKTATNFATLKAPDTSSYMAWQFQNSSGTRVGYIQFTTTATTYSTSSDYRLKDNVELVTDGITRLQQLKPARFNFIADPDTTVDGFLAHEVQDVVPEAITGDKDAVDADGNPIYQGIDQSKLVPLLTAALQEAVAKIESLEARLTAAGI